MFINRKNDGTVKMTRQHGTGKVYVLGMTRQRRPTKLDRLLGRTIEDETLKGYLETAGQKIPKRLVREKLIQVQTQPDLGEYRRNDATVFLYAFDLTGAMVLDLSRGQDDRDARQISCLSAQV